MLLALSIMFISIEHCLIDYLLVLLALSIMFISIEHCLIDYLLVLLALSIRFCKNRLLGHLLGLLALSFRVIRGIRANRVRDIRINNKP